LKRNVRGARLLFSDYLLNFPTSRTPELERRFPEGFTEYIGANPTNVDVVYRWFAPFQHMFGRSPNEGVAKLLSVAIFASLCGTYRSGARTSFRTDFGNVAALPVFSLGSELPSSIFQTILASLINRFENTTI
jgi:hypothetical protein